MFRENRKSIVAEKINSITKLNLSYKSIFIHYEIILEITIYFFYYTRIPNLRIKLNLLANNYNSS